MLSISRRVWRPIGRIFRLFLRHFPILLTTLLLGNNLVNISLSLLSGQIVEQVFGSGFLAYTAAVVTLIVLLFGEVLPKQTALLYARQMVIFFAFPIFAIYIVFYPISVFITYVAQLPLSFARSKKAPALSREAIFQTLALGVRSGNLRAEERLLINRVVWLYSAPLREFMLPRTAVKLIDIEGSLAEIQLELSAAGDGQPVLFFEGDRENILGELSWRELSLQMEGEGKLSTEGLRLALTPVKFYPSSMSLPRLDRQIRNDGVHTAYLLDEYGAFEGVMSALRISETLLEGAYESGRTTSRDVMKLPSGRYLLDGTMTVHAFEEHFGAELKHGSQKTLSGYLTSVVGRELLSGEKVSSPEGEFSILATKKYKVLSVIFVPEQSLDFDEGDKEDEQDEQSSDEKKRK